MCSFIYSQFFPKVWGFTVGNTQRVSRAVMGIWWGLVLGIVVVALLARWKGIDGGYDASGWAWIDVVSVSHLARRIQATAMHISAKTDTARSTRLAMSRSQPYSSSTSHKPG
jgi:hypothetical protein